MDWEEHWHGIVMPAWQAYLRSERGLSKAGGTAALNQARLTALREGGAASVYLHHFADVMKAEKPSCLPAGSDSLLLIRGWVTGHCRMLRTGPPVQDLDLLADIADAVKHRVLTHRVAAREILDRNEIQFLTTGWDELGWGEGKWGGAEQVMVLARSRRRPLSSVLQNVIDAWRSALGWPLPEIGQP